MKKTREKEIIEMVNGLYSKFNLSIPVSFEDLLLKLGINYQLVTFDDNVSGALIVEENKKTICVSTSESIQRQRFSAAHELGHLFLHHDLNLKLDTFSIIYLRDSTSSEGTKEKEIEANFFAANLLMPSHEIEKYINYQKSIEYNVDSLSKIFKVSSVAMAIRLNFLGYQ